ncbi:hypothetical protein O181_031540 [Austropuccinia psidii MF-1]|uniref:protein-tyrosine-phosphatase n=1 Tax=Austropuccinia psidii MF-1 TaxID=1389203 RepID=A0A9Q3CZA3_9BASI|nr:hypothetical protein [Austropuccinia psidii MF-1]
MRSWRQTSAQKSMEFLVALRGYPYHPNLSKAMTEAVSRHLWLMTASARLLPPRFLGPRTLAVNYMIEEIKESTSNLTKFNPNPSSKQNSHFSEIENENGAGFEIENEIEIEIENENESDSESVQYARPMNDPFAEVENGWRRFSESSTASSKRSSVTELKDLKDLKFQNHQNQNDQVLNQLNDFSFKAMTPKSSTIISFSDLSKSNHSQKFNSSFSNSSNFNLSLKRSDHQNSFKPPQSASANKTSFSSIDLSSNLHHQSPNHHHHHHRNRISSFSTDLEPISASPTSPKSPYSSLESPSFSNIKNSSNLTQIHSSSNHQSHPSSSYQSYQSSNQSHLPARLSLSSSTSSFNSSDDLPLPHRTSCSSLASLTSNSSSNLNNLKIRRGQTKPLSLNLPNQSNQNFSSLNIQTPLNSIKSNPSNSLIPNSKSLISSKSLPPSPSLDPSHKFRDQILGMKTNVSGGLSMKRRTSIPRLSLNSNHSFNSSNPIHLIGRNLESSLSINPSSTLHFNPIPTNLGHHELMSSQVGIGGKGHIEKPHDLLESFPYQLGPRQILSNLYLGSEQNARNINLLSNIGFGLIINVAKEVDCPWDSSSFHSTINSQNNSPNDRALLVRPTASTPNLKRSFEGKIRINLPNHPSNQLHSPILPKKILADPSSGRPNLDYIKLPWSHDQDGLAEIFKSNQIFNLIDKARLHNINTLIHCQCGVSRSATLMIAYCMRQDSLNPNRNGGRMHEAYSFVKEKSPWAGPNMGLIYQLIEYEKFLLKKGKRIIEEDEEIHDAFNNLIEQDVDINVEERQGKTLTIVDQTDQIDQIDQIMKLVKENGQRTPTK